MGRLKVNELAKEVDDIFSKFGNNRWMYTEAMVQLIHRENILTGNRIRKRHGEPEIIPEPLMYKQKGKEVGWIIPVPQEWTSLTGKDKS